jgi:hypothetical protein
MLEMLEASVIGGLVNPRLLYIATYVRVYTRGKFFF